MYNLSIASVKKNYQLLNLLIGNPKSREKKLIPLFNFIKSISNESYLWELLNLLLVDLIIL